MRTLQRIGLGLIAVLAVLPIGMPAAHAVTAAPPLQQANWFWSRQVGGTIPNTPVPYPAQLEDPTVPDKSVAVAGDPTQQQQEPKGVDKEAYLQWDLFSVPVRSIVSKFTVVLPINPDGVNGFNPTEPPVLIACAPKGGWSGGEIGDRGDQFSGKPEDNCTATSPKGKHDEAAGTYTFDLTTLAQGWVNEEFNFGIAIRHDPAYVEPYQLTFGPVSEIKASIEYTPAAPVAPPAPPPGPPVAPPVDPGFNTGGGGLVTGPAPAPPAPPAPEPVVSQPPAPAPVVNQPVAPAAARGLAVDKKPTAIFWIALILGVFLLGFMSLVLGDPRVPAKAQPDRGLNRALRQRGLMGAYAASSGGTS